MYCKKKIKEFNAIEHHFNTIKNNLNYKFIYYKKKMKEFSALENHFNTIKNN